MIKSFSLYLALRYLRPKRTFVSVITLISILGVTLGVGVLIVVIAVMAGFHAQMRNLAVGYEAHIEARDAWGTSMFGTKQRPPDAADKPWRDVLKDIRATPGVVSASPRVRGLLLIESEGGMAPAWMWGIDRGGWQSSGREAERADRRRGAGSQRGQHHRGPGTRPGMGPEGGGIASRFMRLPTSAALCIPSGRSRTSPKEKQAAYKQLKQLVLPLELKIAGIINPPQFQDSDKMNIAVLPCMSPRS